MQREDVTEIASRIIEDGSFANALLVSTSPLMDEWKEKVQRDKHMGESPLVKAFSLLDLTPNAQQGIPMGDNSFLSRNAVRQVVNGIIDEYNPRMSLRDWLKNRGPLSYSHHISRSEREGDWGKHRWPESDSLGGYMVPQEYANRIIASFNMEQVVQRKMAHAIATAIDNSFLGRFPMTATQAMQRVYDDPAQAALEATGHATTYAPMMYRGYGEEEIATRKPGILYGSNGEIAISPAKLDHSYVQVGGVAIPCENVKIEYKTDYISFDSIHVHSRMEKNQYQRLSSFSVDGTMEMTLRDANTLENLMCATDSPISGVQFNVRLGNADLRFNGGITECKIDAGMKIWDYPVYYADNDGGRYDTYPMRAIYSFQAWGAIHMTMRDSGLSVSKANRALVSMIDNDQWSAGYIPRKNIVENPSVEQSTNGWRMARLEVVNDDTDDWDLDESEEFPGI